MQCPVNLTHSVYWEKSTWLLGEFHIHFVCIDPSNKLSIIGLFYNENGQWDKQAVISVFYLSRAMTLMKVTCCSYFTMHVQHGLYNLTGSQLYNKIVFLIKWLPATTSCDVTVTFTRFPSAGTSKHVTYCMCQRRISLCIYKQLRTVLAHLSIPMRSYTRFAYMP